MTDKIPPASPGKNVKANSIISQLKHENKPQRHFGGVEGKLAKEAKERAEGELNLALSNQISINAPRKG